MQDITLINHNDQSGTRFSGENVRTLLAIAFLILAVLATFSQTTRCDFLSYDDTIHIARNPWLNPPTWKSVERFWQGPYWGEYVPLTYTLWAWESHADRRDADDKLTPGLFHFVNIALHAMATVAVFVLLKDLTGATGAALLAGLLFGLHPLQVEPVAWISETRGVLSGLFGILAIGMYVRFARSLKSSTSRSAAWYLAATLAFALALLSKSSAVAVVPMLAVIDVLLLGRRARSTFVALLPWATAAVAMAAMMTSQQGIGSIAYRPNLLERIVMSGDAIAFYLGKLVWPTQLCVDYGWYPLFMREQWWFEVLPMLTVALFVAAWLLRRRGSLLLGLLVFVAALSPVLGLVPFSFQDMSLVADRFVYLAMLGPALFLAMSTRRLSGKWLSGIAVALVVVLATLSFRQTLVWRNDLSLSIHAREVNRSSIFAAATLAQEMMRRGDHEEADYLSVEATRLNPHSARAWITLAQVHTFHGRHAAALEALNNALELHPTSSLAHRMVAETMEKQNHLDEAIDHYRLALKYGRRDADRAVLYTRIGSALLRLHHDNEAIKAFESAIEILPRVTIDAWIGLAQARLRTGDTEGALEAARNAETSLPQSPRAPPAFYVSIAKFYADVGHLDDAIRLASQAVDGYRKNEDALGLRQIEQFIETWQANADSQSHTVSP